MKLRFRWNSKKSQAGPFYPIRPRSFFASLCLHGSLIALALFGPRFAEPPRPVYSELIQPQEEKLVWRDFREKLPDVASEKKSLTTRGDRISRRTVVANAPKPKSQTQFIWQPVPKIEIKQDLPLPNLVSRLNLPAPPPVEVKPQPAEPPPQPPRPTKAFIPPTRTTPSPVSVPLLDTHTPLIPLAAPSAPSVLNTAKAIPLPPRPTKVFIPPSRAANAAPVQATLVDQQAPSLAGTSAAGPPVPNASRGTALAALPAAPVAPPASVGNGTADVAVANLHPADRATLPPGGTRAGQFSEAPVKGPADGGDLNGISVPNLAVRDPSPAGADINRRDNTPAIQEPKKPVDPSMPGIPPRTILYAEKIRNIPMSTLSAPLRPASRTIPRDIDARFQGRYVYAMVMPIENLPMYGGDWIMWFAERNQRPGDSPSMRAPVLFRKLESTEKIELPAQTQTRFQMAATITKEGHIEGISLLTRTGAVVEQALIRDLASWEFRPATRDGTAVDVEVVVEIPFNFKQIAEGGRP
jgi:hypothetical protein